MRQTGKFPSCEATVDKLDIKLVGGVDVSKRVVETLMFCCPSCKAIVSAQINPFKKRG